MEIEEKALQLAKYDGWEQAKNDNVWRRNQEVLFMYNLIDKYSSFDKLMELWVNMKTNSNYLIAVVGYEVILHEWVRLETYTPRCMIFKKDWTDFNELKEALMDCLLKYYELIKEKQ